MKLSDSVADAAFALIILLILDQSIWGTTRLGLSMDYAEIKMGRIRRSFPNRWPFRVAKLLIGLSFIILVAVTDGWRASEQLELVTLQIATLASFGLTSFWESIKAFRHFAAENLPPVERGGYRER